MIQHANCVGLQTALDLMGDVQLVDNTHDQSIDVRKELVEILTDLHDFEEAKYEAAQAEVARLREVLKFYADPESWTHIEFLDEWIWRGRASAYAPGAIPAREALNEIGINTNVIKTGDES